MARKHIPNLLTLFRAFCVPWLVWLLVMQLQGGGNKHALGAAVVFVVASITDWIDGWLARRWDVVSAFGKLVDPLADKLIVLAALVMAAELHWLQGWVVVLVVAREMSVNTLRMLAAIDGLVMPAGSGGKWKTGVQMVGITFLLVHVPVWVLPTEAIGRWLVYAGTALGWVSGLQYFYAYLRPAGDAHAA